MSPNHSGQDVLNFINLIHSQKDYCFLPFLRLFKYVSNLTSFFLFYHIHSFIQGTATPFFQWLKSKLRNHPGSSFFFTSHLKSIKKSYYVYLQNISQNVWVSYLLSQSFNFLICNIGIIVLHPPAKEALGRLNDIVTMQGVRYLVNVH